jgi:UDP-N-acetylglucosamine 2-epimerase (non-hydrolysing)
VQILSVVGARPQFVKLAPVAAALDRAGAQHVIVHTGQHYDERMSQSFFDDLTIPVPDLNLEVGSGSHAIQTGQMMERLEPALAEIRPDWVLTYGDTNSTLAAAVVAVKLQLRLAHLEAGLRSFNRAMPEEHNRVLTDHASDLLLAPTETAMGHLSAEGLAGRSQLVGDVMADVCLQVGRTAQLELPNGVDAVQPYIMATIHRAENTDSPERLRAIVAGLQSQPVPVVLAAHPRLVSKSAEHGIKLEAGSVRTVAPYRYPQMVAAVAAAAGVVTDSGGLQKEAYLLGTPCTTVRTETEWVELLDTGWNTLDPQIENPQQWLYSPPTGAVARDLYGDGKAADHAAAALLAT